MLFIVNQTGVPSVASFIRITPACKDGADNDGDTQSDFPADSGCSSAMDPSEEPDCRDGLDNDRDGYVDYPSDPGCADALDNSERAVSLICDDGIDNDGDGETDFPDDPDCTDSLDRLEGNDQDDDGIYDSYDNCPLIANTNQLDTDGDSEGDVCDDDNDLLLDTVETDTSVYVSPSDTGTDPLVFDTDLDGLGDGLELLTYLTDPHVADSEGDGLSDGDEVLVHGTDPWDSDTDDDTLSDGDEVNIHGTNPLLADSDGDGLSDIDELVLYLTNPADFDSDDDGFSDGYEVGAGTDPNDDEDHPEILEIPALGLWGLSLEIAALVAAIFLNSRPRRRLV